MVPALSSVKLTAPCLLLPLAVKDRGVVLNSAMRKAAVTLGAILRPPPPKWTLTKFAKAMGVTRNAARAWIDGDSIPTADKMALIAELFPEVPLPDWLVDAEHKGSKKGSKRNDRSKRKR